MFFEPELKPTSLLDQIDIPIVCHLPHLFQIRTPSPPDRAPEGLGVLEERLESCHSVANPDHWFNPEIYKTATKVNPLLANQGCLA